MGSTRRVLNKSRLTMKDEEREKKKKRLERNWFLNQFHSKSRFKSEFIDTLLLF